MKLLLASDLHLEFGDCQPFEDEADVLVLAGDIMTAKAFRSEEKKHKLQKERFLKFINQVTEMYPEIVYIPGNHEYYGCRFEEVPDLLKAHIPESWHFLNNDTVDINGWKFIGATLWTDCNKGDYFCKQKIAGKRGYGQGMPDFKIVKKGGNYAFTPDDSIREHEYSVYYIREQLKQCEPDKTIVVTHHMPSLHCVAPRFRMSPLMNGAFASDLDWLILDEQPKLWIHGHTHEPVDFMMDKTRVFCHPRGYMADDELPQALMYNPIVLDLDEDWTVEL